MCPPLSKIPIKCARGHPHCFTAQAFGKILHGSVEQLLGTAQEMIMSVSDPFAGVPCNVFIQPMS